MVASDWDRHTLPTDTAFFWGDGNNDWEDADFVTTKNHHIVPSKRATFTVCKLHIDKTLKET